MSAPCTEPPDWERGGGLTPETAHHHLPLPNTTGYHPSGASILKPRRARSRLWPTIACLDAMCINCRCGRSLLLEAEQDEAL